jgi:hypothetical protein
MAMFPQTSAATAALSVAARFYSPALLNHCVRSYLWGTSYASAHGISFDDELYYVSALVHDVGLTDPFDSHRVPFEEAGGDVAWVYWLGCGRTATRGVLGGGASGDPGGLPRAGFGTEFLACFEDQARRKPGSAAAASIASNGAERIKANPLDG